MPTSLLEHLGLQILIRTLVASSAIIREKLRKSRGRLSINVTLSLPPCYFMIRSQDGSFSWVFSSHWMLWSTRRRQLIPKDCLTFTTCCEFPHIPPSPGNQFWNINMWASSTSQTPVLKLASSWLDPDRALRVTELLPTPHSLTQRFPAPHCIPPTPCAEWFLSKEHVSAHWETGLSHASNLLRLPWLPRCPKPNCI